MSLFNLPRVLVISASLALPVVSAASAKAPVQGAQQAKQTTQAPVGQTQNLAEQVSDAQIAGFIRVDNEDGLKIAQLAFAKAQNSEVKAFAMRSIEGHQNLTREANELFAQQGIQAVDSLTNASIREKATLEFQTLQQMQPGEQFDQTFVRMQLERHQGILAMVDNSLLPSVRNSELKDFVTRLRDHLIKAISETQELQSRL